MIRPLPNGPQNHYRQTTNLYDVLVIDHSQADRPQTVGLTGGNKPATKEEMEMLVDKYKLNQPRAVEEPRRQ